MYQGSQQNDVVSSRSDALALVQWLAVFGDILPAVCRPCVPCWGVCLSVLWLCYTPG